MVLCFGLRVSVQLKLAPARWLQTHGAAPASASHPSAGSAGLHVLEDVADPNCESHFAPSPVCSP